MIRSLTMLVICLLLSSCKNVDLQQISDSIQQMQQPLDEKTVVAGLKQALEIGTKNTTAKTSQKDGYNLNALIHIPIPDKLQRVADTLNKIGLGRYADEFELQMNRAAESASAKATSVFIESISRMSLADAWGILRGPSDAATQYFRKDTEHQLMTQFRPIINRSMKQVDLYADYQNFLQAYEKIPFTKTPSLDIEDYVLRKSLDGLFTLVAQEEAKIRKDPAARVTDLLRRVFSQ